MSRVAAPATESRAEWVVFGSSRSGDGDILAVNPKTGDLRALVTTPAPEGTVRYDPARERIVHHRFTERDAVLVSGSSDLFVDPNGDVAPSWSVRGEIVYALEDGETGDLWVADSVGGNPRRLTSDRAIERYPSWSPEGRRVVYAKHLEAGWDLFMMDVESGVEERLTNEATYVGHPAWSPDGSRIAFDTFRGDQTEIAVLELATREIRLVTDRVRNDLVPNWSADGRRIVFGWESEPGNWDVWMVDTETGQLTRLTTDLANDGGPVFVPERVVIGD